MNTSNLKKYAPKARREFMEAVTRRLNLFGISADKKGQLQISEPVISGSVMQIDGNSFDSQLAQPRNRLVERCETLGLQQLVEQMAYTWFNRLCAIRFMELHDYLDHGLRVLSHPTSEKGFEILDHAQDAAEELGLDRGRVVELKLAGNKDEQLYRELLLGQCHKLHEAMPFLFEALDDDTELLLPDNLTRTDSILRGLVDSVPEADWQQVEVIGWLYQFYISEKKDQVIGKVVKSEDIPAATQLFTPNWIVKYLVQNSVGRQWLQTYPDSAIKSQMEYYIEPAEQTPEVVAQLKAITPDVIDPETIKVLDPACGSGHILIEAYNVLKAIYEERGYRSRDIPQLILENNLFGLDIDDRAAQLAGFALMMMAREDDRRIFSRNVKLNVLSLQESAGIDLDKLWHALDLAKEKSAGDMDELVLSFDIGGGNLHIVEDDRYERLADCQHWFKEAKTFGSLIDVPAKLLEPMLQLHEQLLELADIGDTQQKPAAKRLLPFVHQAVLLAQRYDAVVANPPYMGSKYQTSVVKKHLKENYKGYEKDLFSAFIIRNLQLAKDRGHLGFMTPFVWMFISSYEQLRSKLIDDEIISTLVQLEYSGFDGATVPICTFTLTKGHISDYKGCYVRLSNFRGSTNQGPKTLEAISNRECGWFYEAKPDDFKKIPGSPIAYWLEKSAFDNFTGSDFLAQLSEARSGMSSCNSDRFLRQWFEVSYRKINSSVTSHENGKASQSKWFPYNKGGGSRKWYGYNDVVINWEKDGQEIKNFVVNNSKDPNTKHWSRRLFNLEYFFKPCLTWSAISSSKFACRMVENGVIPGTGSKSLYDLDEATRLKILVFLNSKVSRFYLELFSPTLNFEAGDVGKLPIKVLPEKFVDIAKDIVKLSKEDWDSFETSINFRNMILISGHDENKLLWNIAENYTHLINDKVSRVLELENLIDDDIAVYYGLSKRISYPKSKESIDLKRNTFASSAKNKKSHLSQVCLELVSYSLGCMMGRYSLDREGLVYAHAANEGFTDLVTQGAYQTFPADDDGIIPLTDQEWFKDDATNRFREFVKTVWGEEHLQENLDFVAESLCLHAIKPKKGEPALATIRRYLSSQFYKDHLKTYKKRPIYWLFSSGKQKAFECLVYLHRYHEGTLARMRTEYVTPLLGKYDAYLDQLENQVNHASSTADANRLKKERAALTKKQVELRSFDDKLKHYADRRIALDLDDGVKVNYGKFGDLLSDVKAITGHAPENN